MVLVLPEKWLSETHRQYPALMLGMDLLGADRSWPAAAELPDVGSNDPKLAKPWLREPLRN